MMSFSLPVSHSHTHHECVRKEKKIIINPLTKINKTRKNSSDDFAIRIPFISSLKRKLCLVHFMPSQDPQEFGVCQCEQEIVQKREKGKAVGRKGLFSIIRAAFCPLVLQQVNLSRG